MREAAHKAVSEKRAASAQANQQPPQEELPGSAKTPAADRPASGNAQADGGRPSAQAAAQRAFGCRGQSASALLLV